MYLLSLVSLHWVNVEAYNFPDVKCLFRAYVFWRWRLSPVSVHPYMMWDICVEGCKRVLVVSVCGSRLQICGPYS